jgi:hypothetical protein
MDSTTPLEKIIERCLKVGIHCVALTDHGTIAGALRMREISPFNVIVGEEILTTSGEIMGLFLTEGIPSGLSIEESIDRIKAQGGLIGVPHPFDHLPCFSPALSDKTLNRISPYIDFIEVFNSRAASHADCRRAELFAHSRGLLSTAGSDAHISSEIGQAWVEMPEFNSQDEFRVSLAQGKIFGHRTNPAVHLFSTWARLKKRFLR